MAVKDQTRKGAYEIRPTNIAVILTLPKDQRAATVEALTALRKGKR